MKGNHNNIIVAIKKGEKYTEERSGFFIDTTYKPEMHVKGIGRVVAVPEKLTGFNKNIHSIVREGDELLFHYSVIDESNYIDTVEDEEYYMCEYILAFAKKSPTDQDWVMIGGWILCDTAFDDEVVMIDDPTVPGQQMAVTMAESGSGIISSVNIERSTRKAKLVNIGIADKNQPILDVSVGDTVIFTKDIDSELEVDGKTFLIMRQEELLSKEI